MRNYDPRVAKQRAINEAQQRAAGFKHIDDYEKGEEIKVLCPRDGDYISVIVVGTYKEADGTRGLRVHRKDEAWQNAFDAPMWTIKDS